MGMKHSQLSSPDLFNEWRRIHLDYMWGDISKADQARNLSPIFRNAHKPVLEISIWMSR